MKPDNALQPTVPCDISEFALEQALLALDIDLLSPASVRLVVSKSDVFEAGQLMHALSYLDGFVGKTAIDPAFEEYEWMVVDEHSGKAYWSPGA